jgi:hypothetical protein
MMVADSQVQLNTTGTADPGGTTQRRGTGHQPEASHYELLRWLWIP